jgi:Ca2+-binding EF-hand superfamily protein
MSYKLKPIPMDMVRRDPEWIRKLIEENRPYELPIFINTTVFEGIIADLIDDDWHSPSLELLDHTAGLMETAANKYVQSICEIESLPQFRQFLLLKSSEIVENLKEEALVNVVKLVARERTPYTQNHYLFENLSKLRSQRLMEEVMAMIGTGDGEIDKSTVASVVKNVFERNQAKSMDDHMAEEMQHALNAYGKVALKRFIDSIPMICIAVMQEFPKRINDVLSNVLDDDIDRLVVAPPEKMRTMKEYDRKIETLDNGIAAIKKLY